MKKTNTIAALAASALALSACGSESGLQTDSSQSDKETVTVTEGAQKESASNGSGSSSANAQPGGFFDNAAIEQSLQDAGYTCMEGECEKTDGGVIYEIDVEAEDLSAQVKAVEGDSNADSHFTTILSDIGTAFGSYEFSGTDWDEIENWITSTINERSEKTMLGAYEVETEMEVDHGKVEKNFDIEVRG